MHAYIFIYSHLCALIIIGDKIFYNYLRGLLSTVSCILKLIELLNLT